MITLHYAGSRARQSICGIYILTMGETDDITGYLYQVNCSNCILEKIAYNKRAINNLECQNKNLEKTINDLSTPSGLLPKKI